MVAASGQIGTSGFPRTPPTELRVTTGKDPIPCDEPMADDEAMETTTATTTRTNRLERPVQGRVLAGVAAGIADRAGISVGLIRLGFIVSGFFGGFGLLLYLAAWALMPEAGDPDSPSDRWLANLNDPDRRTGAIIVGVAGGIVIISLAPITALAVVALVIGAALLTSERSANRPDDADPSAESPSEATLDTAAS